MKRATNPIIAVLKLS